MMTPVASPPSQGPRLLFFSGGSALRGLSRVLIRRTHRSIHLITPFDSGGSSAALRQALAIPAVGDLRNRVLALADRSTPAQRAIHDLLAHRLPTTASPDSLRRELEELLIRAPDEVRTHVDLCLDAVGPAFDLRRASVGNLALTGLYLASGRNLDGAVRRFSTWVSARGLTCPVSENDLHLAAELVDGTMVSGQHRITRGSKAPVARVFLTDSVNGTSPAVSMATHRALSLIGDADLICYPVGSFFTSVIAPVLPAGIGDAVAGSGVPKVYVPNPGDDPEERGLSLTDRVGALKAHVLPGPRKEGPAGQVVDTLLVDPTMAQDEADALRRLERQGLRIHIAPLGRAGRPPRYDDKALLNTLLALIPN